MGLFGPNAVQKLEAQFAASERERYERRNLGSESHPANAAEQIFWNRLNYILNSTAQFADSDEIRNRLRPHEKQLSTLAKSSEDRARWKVLSMELDPARIPNTKSYYPKHDQFRGKEKLVVQFQGLTMTRTFREVLPDPLPPDMPEYIRNSWQYEPFREGGGFPGRGETQFMIACHSLDPIHFQSVNLSESRF